jgi:hypothetical protein
MGIEQVSLFFYTPRWVQKTTVDCNTRSADGNPLRIVEPERSEIHAGVPVLFETMKDWLESHGFKPANWGDGTIFDYGKVHSLFGTQQEIRIHINAIDGEVAELCCRFSIPSPGKWSPPLQRWGDFFDAFVRRFPLRFGDEQEQ